MAFAGAFNSLLVNKHAAHGCRRLNTPRVEKMQMNKGLLMSLRLLALSMALGVYQASWGLAALIDLTPSGGVNSTSSVALSDLLSGQVMGVAVGDKEFAGFSYLPTGDMPAAAIVKVFGFKDPDGNWGISFNGTFIDLPDTTSSSATIGYEVQIDAANTRLGRRISDAHLFLGGVGVGINSAFTVDETFQESSQSLHAAVSTIGAGSQKLIDSVLFNPTLLTVSVTKKIVATAAGNSTLPAQANVIDQSFSQSNIPEPATIVLSAIGAVALTIAARHRKTAR
jgi:hypothetical protein